MIEDDYSNNVSTYLCVSAALIVLGLVLVSPEYLDGREALDPVLASEGLVLVSINGADLDNPLEGGGGLLILRGQSLAVAAPGMMCQDRAREKSRLTKVHKTR